MEIRQKAVEVANRTLLPPNEFILAILATKN